MASAPTITAINMAGDLGIQFTPNGPYTGLRLERQDVSGTGPVYTQQAAGSVTIIRDTTSRTKEMRDKEVRYRIVGIDASGEYPTPWVTAHTIVTGLPSRPVVVRTPTSLIVSFTPRSPSAPISHEVYQYLSSSSRARMAPLVPHGEGTLTVPLSSFTTSTGELKVGVVPVYTFPAASQPYYSYSHSTTHLDIGIFGLAGPWETIVGAVGTAYAPTPTPSAWSWNPATTALTLAIGHNPRDNSIQTAGAVRYRAAGTTTWTSVSVGTASTYTIPAGTLSAIDWEFQAQTAGVDGVLSPWSDSIVVVGATNPTTALTAPAAGAVLTTGVAHVTWTYSNQRVQSGYQVTLTRVSDGAIIADVSGSGALLVWDSPVLDDGTSYTVAVRTQNSAGLWSAVVSRTFAVDIPQPPVPGLVVEYDVDSGAITATATNPAPGAGEVPAVFNRLYRDGVLISDNFPLDGTWTDRVPQLGVVSTYRLVAVSAIPSTSTAEVDCVAELDLERRWIFVNGGADYSILGRVLWNASAVRTLGVERALVQFEGAQYPTEFVGTAVSDQIRVSGDTIGIPEAPDPGDEGEWGPFETLALLPGPVIYRDPLGRRLVGSISEVTISAGPDSGSAQVSFTVTRTGDAEVSA